MARALPVLFLFLVMAAFAKAAVPPQGDDGPAKYRRHAEKIRPPAIDSVKKMFEKDASYKAVQEWIYDKANWRGALKAIDEKLGLYSEQGFEIKIELHDKQNGAVPAEGGFDGKTGCIKIYVPTMAMVHKSGIQQIGPALTHELVHVFQISVAREKTTSWPDWLFEGMADYAAGDFIRLSYLGGIVNPLDEEVKLPRQQSLARSYGRGNMVFKYLEEKHGASAAKRFADLVVNKKTDVQAALKEATKLDWKKFREEEAAWSAEWIKKVKAAPQLPYVQPPIQPPPAQKPAAEKTPESYTRSAEKISFPSEEEIKKCVVSDAGHKKIIDWIVDRKNWVAAMKKIEERTGLFVPDVAIKISFSLEKSRQAGVGGGAGGMGQIFYYLPEMADVMKHNNAINQRAVEYVTVHELTHVYQGNVSLRYMSLPFWEKEGMCEYAAENLPNVLVQPSALKSLEKEPETSFAYGRGRLFFEYVAAAHGKEKVKSLIASLGGGTDMVKAAESATSLTWPEILKKEQAWSADFVKKEKGKFPNLKFGY